MKNKKEIFWLIAMILISIIVTIFVLGNSGFTLEDVKHKEIVGINISGKDFWISKTLFLNFFVTSFFFIVYLIKMITWKFTNNLVCIVFILSNIALIRFLNSVKFLGNFNFESHSNNFLTFENPIVFIQILLVIVSILTAIFTIKNNKKL